MECLLICRAVRVEASLHHTSYFTQNWSLETKGWFYLGTKGKRRQRSQIPAWGKGDKPGLMTQTAPTKLATMVTMAVPVLSRKARKAQEQCRERNRNLVIKTFHAFDNEQASSWKARLYTRLTRPNQASYRKAQTTPPVNTQSAPQQQTNCSTPYRYHHRITPHRLCLAPALVCCCLNASPSNAVWCMCCSLCRCLSSGLSKSLRERISELIWECKIVSSGLKDS